MLNLLIRFILEIYSLVILSVWGFNQSETFLKYILAIFIPLTAATIWGIFAVPNDPSRSGKTVIKTNGVVRLILELLFFLMAILALNNLGQVRESIILSIVVILHYLLSYKRVIWLIK